MNFDKYEIAYRQKIIQRNTHWQYVIALHFFEHKDVKWRELFEYLEDLLANKHNLVLTHGLVNGPGYREISKYQTYKGTKKKLIDNNFEGINSLSVYNKVKLETEEAGDSLADYDIYISRNADNSWNFKSSKLIFNIDELVLPFNIDTYIDIMKNIYPWIKAQYGYIFRWPFLGNSGDYVIMAQDNFSIDEAEVKRVYKWWGFCSAKNQHLFLTSLRDIFKVNLLSKSHLDVKLQNGHTLRQWISANPSERGTLGNITDDFYYWYIEDESLIPTIHEELSQSGIIVCS